ADLARDKPTYPALLGLDGAHRLAAELRDQALSAVAGFGPAAERLRQLADYTVQRRF
ncbi:MAG: geranyl transferase, partial [Pseudomonadota bacterium]|nr:geranyl transferase [Pseudomonadota bacterium]